MNSKISLTESDLAQFTGTSGYHSHFTGMLYTDGVQYLAEQGQCYWLINAIASYQHKLRRDQYLVDFQLWILSVAMEGQRKYPFIEIENDNGCVLTCWRDTPKEGIKPAVSQQIEYTDFPLIELKLYACRNVLMLPSEY